MNHFVGVTTMVVLLASCATTPQAPKIIEVPRLTYVPIPADLSADCVIPVLTDRTVGGAIDYAVQLKGSLIQCNDRMAGIRAIQGSGK